MMNEINIFNEYKDIDFHKDHINQLINLSLETAQYNQVKINLIFCDNDKLNSFKKKYFILLLKNLFETYSKKRNIEIMIFLKYFIYN